LDDVGPVDYNMQEIIMRLERSINLEEDEGSDSDVAETKLQDTLKVNTRRCIAQTQKLIMV
jgi:hypothetical protein